MGWWFFTRSAIEALTRPPADVEACDRAMDALARGSVIGSAVHRTSVAVRDAWADSRARAAALSIARDLTPAPGASAVRLRGWMAAVTGAMILGLDARKPVPIGPLSWVLPSLMIGGGLLTMLAAAPLARAAEDRRARRGGDKVASSRGPLRLLVVSPIPLEGAGCRFRVMQYVPALEAAGFSVTVAPFFDTAFFRLVYRRGRYLQKFAAFLRQSVARLKLLLSRNDYDAYFVYREAYPFGPPLLETLLAHSAGRPLVYDFDDAVYLNNTSEANRFVSVLKYPQKVPSIIRQSSLVLAGNGHLAEYARVYNTAVSVLPTCVDTSVFVPRPAPPAAGAPLVIGWIGTPTTATYLKALGPALARVAARHTFVLRVSGSGDPVDIPGVTTVNEPWSIEREVELFNTCDIGVYPLRDDEWERGKCGFKAIQFMACGLPVVAAAVGVNREIIQDGVDGFLASTEDEWVEKIERLLGDAGLRRRLGEAGRRTIDARYSLAVNAPKLVSMMRDVVDRKGRR